MSDFFNTCLKAGMTPDTMSRGYHAYAMGDVKALTQIAHIFRNCQGVYNMLNVVILELGSK